MASPHYTRISILMLIGLLLVACGTGPVANETWALVDLLTQGERVDTVTEIIEVRNCGAPEHKTVTCSAGTANELTVGLGGGIGVGEGFSGQIDGSIIAGLGLGRESGQNLDLDVPAEGSIYRYTVNKEFRVVSGEVLVRSSGGNERKADYTFHATCSLQLGKLETLSCSGSELPTPIPPRTPATATPIPSRKPPTATPRTSQTPDYQVVSLQEFGKPEASNLGLKAGVNTLGGIPFETGWTITTQAADRPAEPTVVRLDVNVSHPVEVYLLIQAGWGLQEFAGKQVGIASLSFSSGEPIQVPLVLGENIRDWSRDNAPAVTTATSANLREVWRGNSPEGQVGGMDALTIRVPKNRQGVVLTGIEITDTSSQTAGSQNPCFHLLAVTVMYLR